MLNTTGYLETIKLPDPNWAALTSGLKRAINLLDEKKDAPKFLSATTSSLNALELALTLNDGSTVEGFYKGIQFIPDGALTEGDFIVTGVSNKVLIMCDPWEPYWVEEGIRSARSGREEMGMESEPEPEPEED